MKICTILNRSCGATWCGVPARGSFLRGGVNNIFLGEDAKKIVGGWNFRGGSTIFSFYQRSSSNKVSVPYKVAFCLKSPIFIVQRAYIPKNGVEFCHQTNSDNRTGVATSYDLVRRRLIRWKIGWPHTDTHTDTQTKSRMEAARCLKIEYTTTKPTENPSKLSSQIFIFETMSQRFFITK